MMEEVSSSTEKEQDVDNAAEMNEEKIISSISHEGTRQTIQDCDDITQERWYAAEDGAYFFERREPFFYFNLVSYFITMAVFLYMTVVITEDYIQQQNDPPTSTKVNKEVNQPFPGIIVCNRDDVAQLDLNLAAFEASDGSAENVSDQVEELDCGDGRPACLLLDGQFPGFETDPNNPKTCSGSNAISLAVDINLVTYTNETVFAGIDGYLFTPGSGSKIAESFCLESTPRCQTLASSEEDCPEDLTALSLEPFVASANQGSLVRMQRSEIQSTPKCDQILLKWEPVTTAMQFNPAALPIEESDTVVFVSFEFASPLVSKTTYNPISGQSMFGSLSGWFGFLTDGWGVISLLFFSERTILFLTGRRGR